MFNQAVGGFYYRLCGAVILLQPKFFSLGKVFAEIEDVFNTGTAKGVNTLGIVPDYGDVAVGQCQVFDNQVLYQVGVLVFINQDVPELLAVMLQNLLVLLQQNVGI